MKTASKIILKIVKIAAAALLVLAVIITAINVIALRDFYKTAEKLFILPGLDDAEYCQQGVEYDGETGLMFFTGYMRDGSASPIYLVDPEKGATVKTVILYKEDGTPMNSHSGGITLNGNFVYVAGSTDCGLYIYDKNEIMTASDGEKVAALGFFPTEISEEHGIKVSFVSKDEERIYVGEFYFPLMTWFELRPNHRFETKNGVTHALMVGIPFDENAKFGIEESPDIAYALPDLVQSAVMHDGNIIMTKSQGHFPSAIVTYEIEPEGTILNPSDEIPLYSLREVKSVTVLPMAEEITFYKGKIAITSELYNYFVPGLGGLWGGEWCWGIPA